MNSLGRSTPSTQEASLCLCDVLTHVAKQEPETHDMSRVPGPGVRVRTAEWTSMLMSLLFCQSAEGIPVTPCSWFSMQVPASPYKWNTLSANVRYAPGQ